MTRTERIRRICTARRCQPVHELVRKAGKAIRHKQKIWTLEEHDLAAAAAAHMIVKK